jgi:myo-inositol-1-phosphate synthase
VVDAIRAARVARDRGERGAIVEPSAWLMKHPPRQMRDEEARVVFERWCGGGSGRGVV